MRFVFVVLLIRCSKHTELSIRMYTRHRIGRHNYNSELSKHYSKPFSENILRLIIFYIFNEIFCHRHHVHNHHYHHHQLLQVFNLLHIIVIIVIIITTTVVPSWWSSKFCWRTDGTLPHSSTQLASLQFIYRLLIIHVIQ